jgi:hypothetical protein
MARHAIYVQFVLLMPLKYERYRVQSVWFDVLLTGQVKSIQNRRACMRNLMKGRIKYRRKWNEIYLITPIGNIMYVCLKNMDMNPVY